MKTYARYIVYGRRETAPGEPDDIYRPLESFYTLVEAIDYFDRAIAGNANGPGPTCQYKLIDLEHLDVGHVMREKEYRAMVEADRKRIAAASASRPQAHRGRK